MKKSILTLILVVSDIVLLALIVVSARSNINGQTIIASTTVMESIYEETSETATMAESVFPESSEIYSIEETEDIKESTSAMETLVKETELESVSIESTETDTDEENWINPGMESESSVQDEYIRDVSAYDTQDLPHIKDFKWVTSEIRNGECPEEAEAIYFEESLGGWKCYIIDDETGLERLANMDLSGKEEDIQLKIDWYYIRSGGKEGDAYEDDAPDSSFKGYVNEAGELEAKGPGSIVLTDIYAIGDHMYAFGTIGWPDGMKSSLFMVRP